MAEPFMPPYSSTCPRALHSPMPIRLPTPTSSTLLHLTQAAAQQGGATYAPIPSRLPIPLLVSPFTKPLLHCMQAAVVPKKSGGLQKSGGPTFLLPTQDHTHFMVCRACFRTILVLHSQLIDYPHLTIFRATLILH